MGETWRIVRGPRQCKALGGDSTTKGICDRDAKVIYISPDISGELLADTIIHEVIHGFMWWLDEEYVLELATDAAKLLTRMGFKQG